MLHLAGVCVLQGGHQSQELTRVLLLHVLLNQVLQVAVADGEREQDAMLFICLEIETTKPLNCTFNLSVSHHCLKVSLWPRVLK